MTHFPTSIECHLLEAGFTATELHLLKHLCSGKEFTLREIAGKTGKSTGVLHLAAKKLIAKDIISLKNINSRPHYSLRSMSAISQWLHSHMRKQCSILKQKENDVHLYFSTLEMEQKRPKLEYFDGIAGMEQAYKQLIASANSRMLQYLPLQENEEDTPLFAIKKEEERARRRRGIDLQVITHDSHWGKRFRSTDHLRHRKTVLVAADELHLPIEKIITDKHIGSFDYALQTACIMHAPDIAASERAQFESLWELHQRDDDFVPLDSIPLSSLENWTQLFADLARA